MSEQLQTPTLIKASTARFGEITVPAEDVLHMPLGMIGFPGLQRFVLVKHRPDSPFQWLQSLDAPDVAFVVVSPLLFDPQYNLHLGESETRLLRMTKPEQVDILVVVNIPHGQPQKMTGNLRAPVVINSEARLAAQIVLEHSDYDLRCPLKRQ